MATPPAGSNPLKDAVAKASGTGVPMGPPPAGSSPQVQTGPQTGTGYLSAARSTQAPQKSFGTGANFYNQSKPRGPQPIRAIPDLTPPGVVKQSTPKQDASYRKATKGLAKQVKGVRSKKH